MRVEFITAQGLEVAVYEYGDPGAPAVLCVHGLGGRGEGFSALQEALSAQYRVIALDLPGRGRSEWSSEPSRHYTFDCYAKIVLDVLRHCKVQSFHWVGVSMGGALGIRLAGGLLSDRVKSLTLNDIGPTLDDTVAEQIRAAVSTPMRTRRFSDFLDSYAGLFSRFGMTPSGGRTWKDMALAGSRRTDQGHWTFHYDARVAEQFCHARFDYEQPDGFARITARILVFRGALSTVLTVPILTAMRKAQPDMQVVEIEGVGHAPLLDRAEDGARIKAHIDRSETLRATQTAS